jgi:hypothetical protein
VHAAEYTVDVFEVRATDSLTHKFDWLYHNFGKAVTNLMLEPYAALPLDNGYQHLTNTRAGRTEGSWNTDFMQPGSNLRVHMLGAEGTTVVLGQGLGPDLRVPVPFVMARRQGGETRFVAVYEPYRSAPSIREVLASGSGLLIKMGGDRVDEVTLGTEKPRVVRKR